MRTRTALAALLASGLFALGRPALADEPPPVVITHARVYLPSGKAPLDDATVVLAHGKVAAVGKGIAAPAGARTLDARGKIVTAGFIDAESAVGVSDVPAEPGANDTDTRGALTPALRMADGYNPRSFVVPVTLAAGVTSVVVAPRRGVLGGLSAFVDLGADTVAEAMVRPLLAEQAFLDDDAAQSSVGTRGGMWLVLRQALDDAKFYATHRAQYDANGTRRLSLTQAGLEALVPVVRGERPLVVETHRASDIEAALALGAEYKLRLVLSGASEAWMVADLLARRHVPVIIDPLEDLPTRFDRLHSRGDNAAILSRAGVPVVLATYTSHQSRLLWQRAGNAARMGMDHDAALRAVTEAPADAFGLKGYGRIEPGAVGNVVVWSSDPLEVGGKPEHVFVRGREQSLETRQTLLLDRYRKLPPAR